MFLFLKLLFSLVSVERVLSVVRRHPNGIWLRACARKAGVSPAAVCHYLYGYTDRRGRFVKPQLARRVRVVKMGEGALTMLFLRSRR
jgi:hypothetical protein